ncbi:MAG: hypothetical protein APF81_08810 [Desulfosporosinus sp. BRH_c37]|nr:MAG: hypothetical protein APF81_08810 [Desulfosporosinus sp. BRH_c37]
MKGNYKYGQACVARIKMGLVRVEMHALTHRSPTSLQAFRVSADQAAEIVLGFCFRRKDIVTSAADIF